MKYFDNFVGTELGNKAERKRYSIDNVIILQVCFSCTDVKPWWKAHACIDFAMSYGWHAFIRLGTNRLVVVRWALQQLLETQEWTQLWDKMDSEDMERLNKACLKLFDCSRLTGERICSPC